MVKPNWDTEELIENWTLLPQELEQQFGHFFLIEEKLIISLLAIALMGF